MDFFKTFRLPLILICFTSFSFGQIETGKVKSPAEQKEEKQKEKQKEKEKQRAGKAGEPVNYNPATVLYLGGSLGSGFRTLTSNDGYFGEPLGEKANETPLFTGGAAIGMKTRLANHLYLDFGIALAKNGESYDYSATDSDSTYSYKSSYTHFAVPLKLQFITGQKVKFIAGAGLQPQMFLGYKQDIEWTTTENVNGSRTVKNKNDFNLFTIAAVANVGIEWQFSKYASLYLLPEFRTQLNSTYGKQAPYVHKGMFYGVQFGFSFGI